MFSFLFKISMKTKLFNSLKQDHSKLGLADEVLQAYADSLVATGLVTDENLATVSKGQETALKAFQKSIDKERTEKANQKKELDEYKVAHPEKGGEQDKGEPNKDEPAWFTAYKKEQAEKLEKIEQANNQSKTEKAKADRKTLILQKAKDLKISQERIDEGFAIAEDADEAAISSYLSKIATREVATSLPKETNGFTLSTSDKMLEDVVASSLQSVPDVKH